MPAGPKIKLHRVSDEVALSYIARDYIKAHLNEWIPICGLFYNDNGELFQVTLRVNDYMLPRLNLNMRGIEDYEMQMMPLTGHCSDCLTLKTMEAACDMCLSNRRTI